MDSYQDLKDLFLELKLKMFMVKLMVELPTILQEVNFKKERKTKNQITLKKKKNMLPKMIYILLIMKKINLLNLDQEALFFKFLDIVGKFIISKQMSQKNSWIKIFKK